MQIRKTNFLSIRNPKSPIRSPRVGVRLGPGDSRLGCLAKPSGPRHDTGRPAAPGIHWFIIQPIRRSRRQLHILPRTSAARIDHSRIPQLPPRLQIKSAPLTLRIRSHRPAIVRPLAPRDPQPSQIFHHGLDKLGPGALGIQVFVAQDQLPAPLRRPPCRHPKRARMSEMQKPSRRRRKSPAINSGGVRRGRIFQRGARQSLADALSQWNRTPRIR